MNSNGTEITWSAYQQGFFDELTGTRNSIMLVAVAGAGKSTTIVEGVTRLPATDNVLFLAFNKAIAKELEPLMPSNARAKTFHSVGFTAWARANGGFDRVQVDDNKVRDIMRELLTRDQQELYGAFVMRLVSYAKAVGVGKLCRHSEQAFRNLAEHYGLYIERDDFERDAAEVEREALHKAMAVLEASNAKKNIIDYNDMLFLPLLYDIRFFENDVVFVDEAQDTNSVQLALLQRMVKPSGRVVAVGDPCQPAGTMVNRVVKSGSKYTRFKQPIEQLQVGDLVETYCFPNTSHRTQRIVGITAHDYSGPVIDVAGTQYTPPHQCIVRYRQKAAYCVYLMERGNSFRVGLSRMRKRGGGKGDGYGPTLRALREGADAMWVLDTYETRQEAARNEVKIQCSDGIPGVTFKATNGSAMPQEDFDWCWAGVDNRVKATRVLERFGRDIAYPYYARGGEFRSFYRPHTAFACNVLPGSEFFVRDEEAGRKGGSWKVLPIKREHYSGVVYDMTIDIDANYFGDGILTHNCQAIYGFRGASSSAMEKFKEAFSMVELPLTVSYRCAQAVVQEARRFVAHIEPAPSAPEGVVRVWEPEGGEEVPSFDASDAVLCRTTAPLFKLAYQIIASGTGCRILGREIGEGLVALIKKMRARDVDGLQAKLERFEQREVAKLLEQEKEAQAEAIKDRVDCIRLTIDALPETGRTVGKLVARIRSMFEATGPVTTLCTVHKAKGLEWDRVYVLRPDLMPHPMARKPWEQEQEVNLQYVAITRAKRELVYLPDDSRRAA